MTATANAADLLREAYAITCDPWCSLGYGAGHSEKCKQRGAAIDAAVEEARREANKETSSVYCSDCKQVYGEVPANDIAAAAVLTEAHSKICPMLQSIRGEREQAAFRRGARQAAMTYGHVRACHCVQCPECEAKGEMHSRDPRCAQPGEYADPQPDEKAT